MTGPLIIAHRGLTAGGTENSLRGAARAAAAGADMIELDIRLSLDRQPVILHDAWLRGATHRGHGWVGLVPSPILSRLHLHSTDGQDERVPLLRDLLRQPIAGLGIGLHLKERRALRPVLRLFQREGRPANTWLWLEHVDDVRVASRTFPDLRYTLLRPNAQTAETRARYFIEAQFAGASAVSVPWGAVDAGLMQLARQHSLRVFSVERPGLPFAPPVLAGLDGIITSDPATTRQRLGMLPG